MREHADEIQRALFGGWLLWITFIVYGSLVPFEFRSVPWQDAVEQFRHLPWLTLGLGSRIDWLANVILYVPFGFLGMCASMSADAARDSTARPPPHWLRALVLIALGTALALAVEFAQIFAAPRTVSLNDVVAEIAGMATGTAAGLVVGRRWVALLGRAVRAEVPPFAPLLQLYSLVFLGLCLFPFDFSTPIEALEQKLAAGHAGWWMAPIHAGSPLRTGLQLSGEALLVIPFGLGLGLRRRPLRWPAATLVGLVVGLAIEITQLFLLSATSQGASVLSRAVGFAVGAGLAAHLEPLRRALTPKVLRVLVIACVVPWLLVLVFLAGWGRHPVVVGGWEQRAADLHFLPFYYHYYVGEARALTSVLLNLASYGWVGIGVGLFWARPRPLLAAGLAALAATIIEGSQLFLLDRRPDPTNVLIGAASAWIASAVVQRLRWRASATSPATQPTPRSDPIAQAFAAETQFGADRAQALALVAAAAILGATYALPGHASSMAVALAAYASCVWYRPQTALFLVPILIGLTDVAAFAGPRWLDTLDLAMLATGLMAVAHPLARTRDADGKRRRMPAATWWLLGLVPGTLVGSMTWTPGDPNALLSPLGSAWGALQGKGLLWAFVLAMFLSRVGVDARVAGRMFGRGMVLALAGVALLTIKERLAFVGPLDFTSDYRAPGPFSAISLGGAFIECFLAAAAPFAVVAAMREDRRPIRWACALLVLVAAYATMVTFSRGGQVVFLFAVAVTSVLLASRRFIAARHERKLPGPGKGLVLVTAVGALAASVLLAPYATSRFATLSDDASVRLEHWRTGLTFGKGDATATLFGNGMGSFGRQSYLLEDPKTRPGMFTLMRDDANTWLRVRPGSLSYLDQPVDANYRESFTVTARVRADSVGRVAILLCEKDLVQSRTCGGAKLSAPADGKWHAVSSMITLPPNPMAGWPVRPVRLTLFSEGGELDVDDLAMIDERGNDRLRNGNFEDGPTNWLYSSDMHLTWHMKNLWLQVFFEQGVAGVLAHAGLLLAGLLGAWRAAAAGQSYFLAVAVALLAFQGVGLIDSVIDTPRFLQLYLSLALVGSLYGRGRIVTGITTTSGRASANVRSAAPTVCEPPPASSA